MSYRADIGQSTVGTMGIGVDTATAQATVDGTTTTHATPTGVVVETGVVTSNTTATASLFRLQQTITLNGSIITRYTIGEDL